VLDTSFPNANDDFVKTNERDEMVIYLLELCEREDVAFSLDTYALSVSLLDRFLANFKVKSKYLECSALACLYVASKVKEENEKILSARLFLEACNCKLSIAELLRMELMILSKFEWNINDVTVVDFIYVYHALLVNKYNQLKLLLGDDVANENGQRSRWQQMLSFNTSTATTTMGKFSAYPPRDLDFLHLIEMKAKKCLCVNELTINFKPHVLAFSLIALQTEKEFCHIEDNSIRNAMIDMVKVTLFKHLKLDIETIVTCKEQINNCLISMEYMSVFFDRYYLNMAFKSHRMATTAPLLSAINSQLSVIEEEDECEGDETRMEEKTSYADVLKKRKLSENGSTSSYDGGEDLEFEIEN
jgi:hypothetical protein